MENFIIKGININHYPANKPSLILIHAFPLHSGMWQPQVDFFKDKYNLITYDVRALGKSITTDFLQTMESYADDLLMIIDEMKLEKVNVCGLSMGSYIAQRAAVKSPDNFLSVTLAASRAERDTDEGLINRSKVISSLKKGGRENFINSFIKNLISEKGYKNEKVRNFILDLMESNSTEGICTAEMALATKTNTLEDYSKLNIPTLILVGDSDIPTPRHFAETMHRAFNNSLLKVIPDAGHICNIENPSAFNSALENFLTEE
jgi:pimeloyl-ACP methyl ester carboxylesterase